MRERGVRPAGRAGPPPQRSEVRRRQRRVFPLARGTACFGRGPAAVAELERRALSASLEALEARARQDPRGLRSGRCSLDGAGAAAAGDACGRDGRALCSVCASDGPEGPLGRSRRQARDASGGWTVSSRRFRAPVRPRDGSRGRAAEGGARARTEGRSRARRAVRPLPSEPRTHKTSGRADVAPIPSQRRCRRSGRGPSGRRVVSCVHGGPRRAEPRLERTCRQPPPRRRAGRAGAAGRGAARPREEQPLKPKIFAPPPEEPRSGSLAAPWRRGRGWVTGGRRGARGARGGAEGRRLAEAQCVGRRQRPGARRGRAGGRSSPFSSRSRLRRTPRVTARYLPDGGAERRPAEVPGAFRHARPGPAGARRRARCRGAEMMRRRREEKAEAERAPPQA